MGRVTGFLMVAVLVLATIYAYNRFSGKNVSALGSKTAA
jgi:hypothetical protein